MNDHLPLSYKVAIWQIVKYRGVRGSTYRVRWKVESEVFSEIFKSATQADSFRSRLVQAQSRGEGFSLSDGRPVSMHRAQRPEETWYSFARRYTEHVWPDSSGHHRANTAFALMMATLPLLTTDRGKPDDYVLRKALRRWHFNPTQTQEAPEDVQSALTWLKDHTLDVADLADQRIIQSFMKSATTKLNGRSCAPKSRKRNHSVLKNALDFAVDEGLLEYNPLPRLEGLTPGRTVHQVDRRRVVNPEQAGALLDAVRDYGHSPTTHGEDLQSGPRMVALFAAMYYAALRPEEAINLSEHNLALSAPHADIDEHGHEVRTYDWGELNLGRATPAPGKDWTGTGSAREDRPLKQRDEDEERLVPCPPELTRLLWEHLERFGTDSQGRLFQGVRGGPLPEVTYLRAWRQARRQALTPAEARSPLARRPYDLRHACVSTWLNAGVSETLVARWAGHSVAVLKKVYAKCLVGEEERAKEQIDAAFGRGHRS